MSKKLYLWRLNFEAYPPPEVEVFDGKADPDQQRESALALLHWLNCGVTGLTIDILADLLGYPRGEFELRLYKADHLHNP